MRKVSTNIQKSVITTSKLKFCEFSAFFIPAYVISYLQMQQTKSTLN